jgi:hypothetical protein
MCALSNAQVLDCHHVLMGFFFLVGAVFGEGLPSFLQKHCDGRQL